MSINIPSVTRIDYNAFQDCRKLSSINLPSATSIFNSFGGCDNLSSVSLTSKEYIYLYDCFENNSTNIDLTLHINKKEQVSGLIWNNLTWKSIRYVDDNGKPVVE